MYYLTQPPSHPRLSRMPPLNPPLTPASHVSPHSTLLSPPPSHTPPLNPPLTPASHVSPHSTLPLASSHRTLPPSPSLYIYADIVIGFERTNLSVGENDGTVQLCTLIRNGGQLERTVRVDISTQPGTAEGTS